MQTGLRENSVAPAGELGNQIAAFAVGAIDKTMGSNWPIPLAPRSLQRGAQRVAQENEQSEAQPRFRSSQTPPSYGSSAEADSGKMLVTLA